MKSGVKSRNKGPELILSLQSQYQKKSRFSSDVTDREWAATPEHEPIKLGRDVQNQGKVT